MFRKFTKEDIHSRSNIKSSQQRNLKAKWVRQFPALESVIDDIIPKKSQVILIKCEDKIQLYCVDNKVVAFQQFDDLIPSLEIVHKYPDCFPKVQVDRGAIKFVLSGANIMCPGLTSPGAQLPEENLEKGTIVTIYAEGKEHALAVGALEMSTDDIKSLNKNVGVELFHHLGDCLWNFSFD
ncbi:translation machinery-associated protein 20 [Komagataella kurtzmanii]|nr:translation machinery-associated protein 20 [Komagataella kurtzmanii]